MPHIYSNCLFFSILFTFMFLTGCESDQPKPNQDKPPALNIRKVDFFHYFSGPLSGGIDEMVAAVNQKTEGYKVLASALDHEAFKTMIPTSLDRGTPPELFSYWAGERVRQLVDKDQLLEIDDLWAREKLSSSFSPAIINSAVTYNEKKYLLPIAQHTIVFFYNKNIFDDLGLNQPNSWPEFLTLCRRLQEAAVIPIALGARERWPAQFWFDFLLLRTAGPDFRNRLLQGLESFTAQQVIDVFRMWSELLQKHYFNSDANSLDWAEAAKLVRQGKAAMTLMGSWAPQVLGESPENLIPGEGYDFFPFPPVDTNQPLVVMGPIDGIVISRSSENYEFAKEVLTYFASTKAQKIMSTGSGALSPNHTIPESFYSPFKLRLKHHINKAEQWAFAFDLATRQATAERGLDSLNELIEFPAQYLQILSDLQDDINDQRQP